MTKALRFAAGLLWFPASAAWAQTGPAACGPAASSGYPSFCDIPQTPTDVRGAVAFKAAVVDTRLAGRRVVRATAPDTFGLPLGEADAFSRAAQAEAAPPAELSTPHSEESEALAGDLRRRAIPPPRRPK